MENKDSKPDFLSRRVDDLDKIFKMALVNPIIWLLVISVLFNYYLGKELISMAKSNANERITDLKEYMQNDGKQVIREEVAKELEPTKQDVKSTTEEIKQSINNFKEKMQ